MSNFAQRLYNHEAEPPPGAWDRIAAAIPADISPEVKERLFHATATPPPGAWQKIEQSLDEATAAPVTSRRVISMFTRYAAAAAILVAITTTAFLLFNRHTNGAQLAEGEITASPVAPSQISAGNSDSADQAAAGIADVAAARPTSTTAGARVASVAAASHRIRRTPLAAPENDYRNPLYAYEDHVPLIAERYVMLMTPDGSFIRMSKKLGELVCCVTGQEQDEQCKSQIKKWQEEIASSQLGPGNVMDVLDLVTSLDNGVEL